MCQYNNLYAYSYKYLKEKKKCQKKKKTVVTVTTVPLEQTKSGTIATVQNLREKNAHYTKRGIVEALPLFI